MKSKKKNQSKSSLYLRLVAGFYLLYTDYSLISNWEDIDSNMKVLIGIVIIVFGVFGILFIINSAKGIIRMEKNERN